MTEFVGVAALAEWVRRTGPERVLTDLVEHLRQDVLRWREFERIPRVASHTPLGVIELMPVSDAHTYAFKYVNGHPGNPARGLQTVTAFGVLADVDSGYPVFMAEMTLLTALRTAATSAVAARALARPGPQVHGLIGAGSQAEFQALAMRTALGVSRLQVYDVDPSAVAKLARNLTPLGFTVDGVRSAADAAAGADIVTTCTADKALATVLLDADVAAGQHLNAIGGDCPGKTELDPAILNRARVVVEHAPQTFVEGEIQSKPRDFPVTELWQVLIGERVGREGAEDITLFDSVGFAIEDLSALTFLRESVRDSDLVEHIDLVAEPDDPKDLFGMVAAPVPVG